MIAWNKPARLAARRHPATMPAMLATSIRDQTASAAAYRASAVRLNHEGPLRRPPAALAAMTATRRGFFWLDSGGGAPGTVRWSFLGLEPERVLEGRDGRSFAVEPSGGREPLTEPRAFPLLAREWAARRALPPQAPPESGSPPPFGGGWFALLSYDLGRELETLPARAEADLPFPDLYLAFHPLVLAFDHLEGCWWASCLLPLSTPPRRRAIRARAEAEKWLSRLPAAAASPLEARPAPMPRTVRSTMTRARYEAAAARALEYIAAGDIYQVNLSQRFEAAWEAPAFELFLRLREKSPAPHAAFANLGGQRALLSVSPELFLSLRGREVQTRPIKGTRPRGGSTGEDRRLAAELEASAKDRAELTMIVDLERNDLGKICEYGSVRVSSPGALETHPTVFHRVATVAGRLPRRGLAPELLRAMFPGGSVTGAPKIRAMEIIEELEPTRRGPYCGAIGWLGADGDLELNLAIRTALVDGSRKMAWYQAGGAIVADSDPADEYEESLDKARAFLQAVNGRRMDQ